MNILVVVDMQNDFIDGSLGTNEAQKIVDNVKRKIDSFQGEVIFTRDTHDESYLQTPEGKSLPVEHCIKGTKGWEIREGLVTDADATIIDKPTFGSVELVGKITQSKHFNPEEDTIELVGLCTDICVISNALLLKAYFYDTPIIVDSSCCAGVSPESHDNALNAMKMCQIVVN